MTGLEDSTYDRAFGLKWQGCVAVAMAMECMVAAKGGGMV